MKALARFLALGGFLLALPAQAETQSFLQALAQAYESNPALQAARAKARAADEGVALARSAYRPSVDGVADAGFSRQNIHGGPSGGEDNLQPRSAGLQLTQPVFRGFRSEAGLEGAQAQAQAARAALLASEQALLLEGAQAYLDVVLAQRVRDFSLANEDMLAKELEATQSRFGVGEVTKTDISQAEARLSVAKASRLQAEGDLAVRRATFARVMGSVPATLAQPTVKIDLPSSLDEAQALAEHRHPAVLAAQHGADAAQADMKAAKGSLLPEVSLVGSASRAWDQSLLVPNRQDSSSIMARVTIPLYRAGADYARTRAAREVVVERRLEREDIRARAREGASSAWQALTTVRASLLADQAALNAATSALHGVQEESKVGTRSVLDVLNAQQELLAARVALARAERDEAVSMLALKASVGGLTAQALSLPVKTYDPQAHYEEVQGKWWGVGEDR